MNRKGSSFQHGRRPRAMEELVLSGKCGWTSRLESGVCISEAQERNVLIDLRLRAQECCLYPLE